MKMPGKRAIEIQGLLISVDVAAALQARDVVRYGDVADEVLPSDRQQRSGAGFWFVFLRAWRSVAPKGAPAK